MRYLHDLLVRKGNNMVTVIITTYGGDMRLSRAVKSVLNQSYKDIQIIIVDDNSPETDGRRSTEKQMEKFFKEKRVEYIKHSKNRNAAVARNTGINAAKGKYICFLDDDDYFLPDHIEQSVKCCNENVNCVGVVCNVAIISAGMLSDIYLTDKDTMCMKRVLKTHNIGTGSNLFVLADAVRAVHGFDEEFVRNQDIEFILRILDLGSIKCQDRISIVKDISSSRKLDYYKLKSSYERFDRKFQNLISYFSQDFQKKYYAERVHSLLATATVSGDEDAFEEAILAVNKIDNLSKEEKRNFRNRKVVLSTKRIINFFRYRRGGSVFNIIMKFRYMFSHVRYKKIIGRKKIKEIFEIYRNY